MYEAHKRCYSVDTRSGERSQAEGRDKATGTTHTTDLHPCCGSSGGRWFLHLHSGSQEVGFLGDKKAGSSIKMNARPGSGTTFGGSQYIMHLFLLRAPRRTSWSSREKKKCQPLDSAS